MSPIEGQVVQGKHLGRKLGIPTANINAEASWPYGVYAVEAYIDGSDVPRRAVANIGKHPTAPEGAPTIEVHVIDLHADLYGHRMRIECLERLRSEIRFSSLDELREQLKRDVQAARRHA